MWDDGEKGEGSAKLSSAKRQGDEMTDGSDNNIVRFCAKFAMGSFFVSGWPFLCTVLFFLASDNVFPAAPEYFPGVCFSGSCEVDGVIGRKLEGIGDLRLTRREVDAVTAQTFLPLEHSSRSVVNVG